MITTANTVMISEFAVQLRNGTRPIASVKFCQTKLDGISPAAPLKTSSLGRTAVANIQ